MSHILAAVSSPWADQHMAGPLARLARRMEADVTLLHVARTGGGDSARIIDEGRQAIVRLGESLAAEGIRFDTRFMEKADDLPTTILSVARESQASLILMGITGKSAFARSVSGDIPTELLRRTTIPVLLLPPGLDVTL